MQANVFDVSRSDDHKRGQDEANVTPDIEKDRYPRGANRPFDEQAFVALGWKWMRGSIVIEEKKKELRRTGMINNSVSRGGIIISQRNGRENRLVTRYRSIAYVHT